MVPNILGSCISNSAHRFTIQYADKSGATGKVATDDVTIAGLTVKAQAFGAVTSEQGQFNNGVRWSNACPSLRYSFIFNSPTLVFLDSDLLQSTPVTIIALGRHAYPFRQCRHQGTSLLHQPR